MTASFRPYRSEEDYWLIRQFLREVSLLNDRHDFSWSLLRWDYWRWHVNENIFQMPLEQAVMIWEEQGRIVAVLNADNPGETFIQFHPLYRTDVLMAEVLKKAEEGMFKINESGQKELIVWVNAWDTDLKSQMTERGYVLSRYSMEHMRRRPLLDVLPVHTAPVGYTVRALGGEDELPARSWLSWKAFHPNEADEKYEGWEWYRNIQRVPLYRRDLDLVAVSAEGELAAFCTVWFDDVTRTAVFEPVGTHPSHQQRGLGKAVMSEGMRRAQRLGATLAAVSSYGTAAHALYHSMGFVEYDLLEPWVRMWSAET